MISLLLILLLLFEQVVFAQTTNSRTLDGAGTKITSTNNGGKISLDANISNVPHIILDSGVVTANAGTNLNTSALNLEATQALIKAKTDNLDVALSTLTKPADTQLAAGTIIQEDLSTANLASSATYTTASFDLSKSKYLNITAFMDQPMGVTVNWSHDNVTFRLYEVFFPGPSTTLSVDVPITAKYAKVAYQNLGASTTTALVLQTIQRSVDTTNVVLQGAIDPFFGPTLGQPWKVQSTVVGQSGVSIFNACTSVGGSSTAVDSSGATRAAITVTSLDTNTDRVRFNLGAAATTGMQPLLPGQSWTVTGQFVPSAQVFAIAESGTQTVCVLER